MFTTPRKSGSSSAWNTPKKVPLNGLFQDGNWHCNCDPRLPASHFQVKKEGPNKGKWFYTCQQPKGTQCRFFLWDSDAAGREMRAVMNNSRSETDEPETPTKPSGNKRAIDGYSATSNKFIEGRIKAEQDDIGDWPLSTADEVDLLERASVPSPSSDLETPRKAVKIGQFATSGSKRKWDETSLPTPTTGGRKGPGLPNIDGDVFTTTPSIYNGRMLFGLQSPSATPTPSRFRDATFPITNHGEPTPSSYNITGEVMELLKDQKVDQETTTSLCQFLDKHALRVFGISRGRDVTRAALKNRDAKIADLQQKITDLEAEREMDKTIINHLKSDMAQSVANRRGRGQGEKQQSS